MKKPILVGLLALTLVSTSGCAALMQMMGDQVANAITSKTSNLQELSVRAFYTTNLFPTSSGLMEASGQEGIWNDGQNLLSVNLLKRSGIGMYELEGTVGYQTKAGGPVTPLKYLGKGSYAAGLAANDNSPKIIVVSAGGQTASFPITAAKPITIKAINGKPPKGAVIDLSQDLVLDLAHAPGATGMLKLSLGSQAMGIKTMNEIAVFKSATRVTIPKHAFRNALVSASQDVGAVGFLKGESLLLVERFDGGASGNASVGAAELLGRAWSWAPVTVGGDAPMNIALQLESKVPGTTSDVFYRMRKPNAYYGPPLLPGKTFAMGSVRARATLWKKTVNTREKSAGVGLVQTVTTTTTLKFPQLPDSTWNGLLTDLERRMTASVKKVAGITVLPIERMNQSPTYRSLEVIDELKDTREAGNATKYMVKTLRGSRHVFPESFIGMTSSVSSTFAADRPVSRMLRESKVDGLMITTLDLQIGTLAGGEQTVLVPSLSYSLYGPPNGYAAGPTSYGDGQVWAADGMPFSGDELKANPAALSKVVRLDELMAAFERSLREMRAQETAEGYDAIWKLH